MCRNGMVERPGERNLYGKCSKESYDKGSETESLNRLILFFKIFK